jgi:hypothetical protein
MNDTIIEQIEAAYASEIETINPLAEVRCLGGNIYAIVEYCDYGDAQYIATYTLEDLGLPPKVEGETARWYLTIRDEADETDYEVLLEAKSKNLEALVAAGATFMGAYA